jgi:hypothetical protein
MGLADELRALASNAVEARERDAAAWLDANRDAIRARIRSAAKAGCYYTTLKFAESAQQAAVSEWLQTIADLAVTDGRSECELDVSWAPPSPVEKICI